MRQKISELFLNDKVILTFIIANAAIIFAQESGANQPWLFYLDIFITMVFVVEMIVKHYKYGAKKLLERCVEQVGWRFGNIVVAIAIGDICAYGNKYIVYIVVAST